MRTVELVMESLRADLESALPPSRGGKFAGSFEGTSQQIDEGIEADDLVFYGTAPAPYHAEGSNGEIKQFELTCYQPTGSSDHILVRRTFNNLLSPTGTSANAGRPPSNGLDEEILCRNVQGLHARILRRHRIGRPTWDSTQASNQPANSLPLAVMVTLTLPSSDKTDAAGKPLLVNYTRIFQMPCNGAPPGATAGVERPSGAFIQQAREAQNERPSQPLPALVPGSQLDAIPSRRSAMEYHRHGQDAHATQRREQAAPPAHLTAPAIAASSSSPPCGSS